MFWGGTVFTTGWIVRSISTYQTDNLGLYIAQSVMIYGGPPIYSAAEYNILGRLLYYLPMHAPLHPGRVLWVFLYLGVIVESVTAAGAARIAANRDDLSVYKSGGTLIAVGLILQAVVECMFITMVAIIHRRCVRFGVLPTNVRTVCIMLYGTSTLILLRCLFRAVEAFATYNAPVSCSSLCLDFLDREWYIYVFDAGPMVVYTYWLNIIHPGRFLPSDYRRYLDLDGKAERHGPGWIDRRTAWKTFVDPLEMQGRAGGDSAHEKFWLQPDGWPVCDDGSFAQGSATNAGKRVVGRSGKE